MVTIQTRFCFLKIPNVKGCFSKYLTYTKHVCTYSNASFFIVISNMVIKGHLSWSFYLLYVLGIVDSHIINYILVSISSDILNKTDI